MNPKKPFIQLRPLLAASVFAVASIALMMLFLHLGRPQSPTPRISEVDQYSNEKMLQSITPDRMRRQLSAILRQGPRFMGSPGYRKTEDYLRETFEKNGLRLMVQTNYTAVPQTSYHTYEIMAQWEEHERKLFPFLPNYVQPIVTPEEGITGKLVLLTDDLIRSSTSLAGCIGLISTENPPQGLGYNWIKYAQLGLKAIIISHPGQFSYSKIDWTALANASQFLTANPVNFIRVMAGAQIFSAVDKEIRLKVRVEFQNVENHTLIGCLKSSIPTDTAVIINSGYDSYSMLPDLSRSQLQAVPIATQVALMEGLVPYQSSITRDVFFVSSGCQVMAQDGDHQLLRIIGPQSERKQTRQALVEEHQKNKIQLEKVEMLSSLFSENGFFENPDLTEARVKALSRPDREFLLDQIKYLLNSIVFGIAEEKLQAKIAFSLDESQSLKGEPYLAYQEATRKLEMANSCSTLPVEKLLRTRQKFLEAHEFRQKCIHRFAELKKHHAEKNARLENELRINEVFLPYKNIIVISPLLLPSLNQKTATEEITFLAGSIEDKLAQQTEMQGPAFYNLLTYLTQKMKLEDSVKITFKPQEHSVFVKRRTGELTIPGNYWTRFGYHAFTLLHLDRTESYVKYSHPVTDIPGHDFSSMESSLKLLGELMLSVAHGNGSFKPQPKIIPLTTKGQVLVSNIGQSILPNYPLKNALVAPFDDGRRFENFTDFYLQFVTFTDVYGRYEIPNSVISIAPPLAVSFGTNGLIQYINNPHISLNQSATAKRGKKPSENRLNIINPLVFRATPMSLPDMINPQSFQSFSEWELVSREGLGPVGKSVTMKSGDFRTSFIEPDKWVYIKLKAGSVENEQVQETRAFMLGIGPSKATDPAKEIDGQGYLASANYFLLNTPFEIVHSMTDVNEKRLKLQTKHQMVDEQTIRFHAKSRDLLSKSMDPSLPYQAAINTAREAATYQIMNHPVLRNSVFEAIRSILWYLGLLVPFVFFFEKLVFGFTDIRKQLVAQLLIFLTVFGLFKLLHPAFEMIRSSAMILIGFIILLISLGITALFSGKFKENLDELRKQRGKVSAAEVDKAGVVLTSFMLGLNNMHRRKVRTGLTCATLVFMTFCMICFTSINTDLVDTSTAIGKSPYQGILVKKEKYLPIRPSEEFALVGKYAQHCQVSSRVMWLGSLESTRLVYNPELELVFDPGKGLGSPRIVQFDSLLQFSPNEPLRDQLSFVTQRKWFSNPIVPEEGNILPVMLPDTAASRIGISAEQVDQEKVYVKLNGKIFRVHSIFSARSLEELKDIDGRHLLPFDLESMPDVEKVGIDLIADEGSPYISPDKLVIAPVGNLGISIPYGYGRTTSVVISFNHLGYKEAKGEIDGFLEQSGKPTFYGLDEVSYLGKRAREKNLFGFIDMILPLVIAGLTVLNTMKGSVYERRDEIFVYNAVGIAPRYIFFMFMAEAMVYAVVGAVLGYLLSQGTGRILTELNLTGGLNMNFTSLTPVYASLTIAASALLSTWFPARSAMQMAAPAEDAGWKLPEPEDKTLSFNLPFTFDPDDRIAVLAFFNRFFLDHGEGSSGTFFCNPPSFGIDEGENPSSRMQVRDVYIPKLTTTIWLKPFDLGVSQRINIRMPEDPETGEFIAHIELAHLSGTREAWLRLNHFFVKKIREHFLHWRAVPDKERAVMFQEAGSLMREHLLMNALKTDDAAGVGMAAGLSSIKEAAK